MQDTGCRKTNGTLVRFQIEQANLPRRLSCKYECRKNGLAQEYDNHPVYGRSSDVKRYCSYKAVGRCKREGTIMLETRPNYEVIYANQVDTNAVIGEVVQIDEPRTMYYDSARGQHSVW